MHIYVKMFLFALFLILSGTLGNYTANLVTQTTNNSVAQARCEDDLCAVDDCKGLSEAEGYNCDMTGSNDCETYKCGNETISFY